MAVTDVCRNCDTEVPSGAAFCIRCGKPMAPDVDPYLGQELLGRYCVEERVATSALSWMYRARHAHLRPRRLLKILRPELRDNRDAVDAFWRDANIAGSLRHDNVAILHDIDLLTDGTPCSVWEASEGQSLSSRVAEQPLVELAIPLIAGLCAAVAELHEQHLAHLDLHADNVVVTSFEHGLCARLQDFSEARRIGSVSGRAVEDLRLGFVAPEQFEREPVDPRSDVFALAALLVYASSGRLPVEQPTLETYIGSLRDLRKIGSVLDELSGRSS